MSDQGPNRFNVVLDAEHAAKLQVGVATIQDSTCARRDLPTVGR
jgi:hypothetical protein